MANRIISTGMQIQDICEGSLQEFHHVSNPIFLTPELGFPEFPNQIASHRKTCGAGDRTRTYDPIITNDVLYQLSYTGAETLLWTY